MSVDIPVPALPESVSEATVVAWHKQPGDPVSRDENLVDLETDKVVLEVPAPADGVLEAVQKATGDTVVAEDVLGSVDETATAGGQAPARRRSPRGKRRFSLTVCEFRRTVA